MKLTFKVPVDKGNEAFTDGTLASTIQTLVQKLEPEAAYFGPEGGKRAGFLVFDMKDSSQISVIAELLFSNLHADVDFTPVMNADDLKKGLSQ